MKTFLIILKNGASFTINASRIDYQIGTKAKVYPEGNTSESNAEVFLHPSEVAAIIPTELLVPDDKSST